MGPNLPNPMHAIVNALGGAVHAAEAQPARYWDWHEGVQQRAGTQNQGFGQYFGQQAQMFNPAHPEGAANILAMLFGRKAPEMPMAPRAPMRTLDPMYARTTVPRPPGMPPSQVMVNQHWLAQHAKEAAARELELGPYTPKPLPPGSYMAPAKALRNSFEAPTMWGQGK